MSKLELIPTPLRVRWQQVRTQLLPVFICGGASLAVISLWKDVSGPVGIPGEVQVVSGAVVAPAGGFLTEVQVERFDFLEAGETIGWLITTPPELTQSSLAVLRAEIELTRLGWIDPVLDQQRNLLEVESIKLDLLSAQAELAVGKIQWMQAQRELARKEKLFERTLIAEENLESARLLADVLEAEVEGKEELAAQLERSLAGLGGIEGESPDFAKALRATLTLQAERLKQLEAELGPVPLRAPMAGIVSEIYFRNGGYIPEGEIMLDISSPRSDTIIAYMRQPLTVPPIVGSSVEVRSRRGGDLRGTGQVVSIGPRVQELSLSLQRPGPFQYETGLPIMVSLPSDLDLLPGEIVDVVLP